MSAAVRQALSTLGARVAHARWSASRVVSELRSPWPEHDLDHEPEDSADEGDEDEDIYDHFPRP